MSYTREQIKEIIVAALWEADSFVTWYPMDEDGHCDGINTIDSKEVNKWFDRKYPEEEKV